MEVKKISPSLMDLCSKSCLKGRIVSFFDSLYDSSRSKIIALALMGARVNLLTGFVDAFCKGADLISAMIIINWACLCN